MDATQTPQAVESACVGATAGITVPMALQAQQDKPAETPAAFGQGNRQKVIG